MLGWLIIIALFILTVFVVGEVIVWRRRRKKSRPTPIRFDADQPEAAKFLFDNRLLVDATDAAHAILRRQPDEKTPWRALMAELEPQFSDIESQLAELKNGDSIDIWSPPTGETHTNLRADWRNRMLRVTVLAADEPERSTNIETQNLIELNRDVATLRAISEHSPILVWKTDAQTNSITWANRAYLDRAEAADGGQAQTWPPRQLFERKDQDGGRCLSAGLNEDGSQSWFDLSKFQVQSEFLHFAVPADATVQAEGMLREFSQTLAKTFAHLPIGLAIFNRDRRLVLFNPALTDLANLRADFLTARPTLSSFLDELRNRQIMPEPKNYKGWRQKLITLEAEASEGTYEEIWTMANDQIFRVTGRPHPEGAIAFLFEDITSEVSVTRRFRSDMEIGQSVLDSLPEGIAVFSNSGALTLSNAAYGDLWGLDPSTTLGEITILDSVKHWLGATEPTPVWGDVREFVESQSERAEWCAQVTHKSGSEIACRFRPLPAGCTMISFTAQPALPDHQIQATQPSEFAPAE